MYFFSYISSRALQFAVIDNLTSIFNSVENLYLYTARVDVPVQYTSTFTTTSTLFTLATASATTIPPTLIANKPLYQQLGLSMISDIVVTLHDNITIPIVVSHFDSTSNSSFAITVTNLPQYFKFVANDYTKTGIAYITFYVSDSVPLDANTHGAEFDNITVTLTSQTGIALASLSFSVTVSACPVGYTTCKNFACALNDTCGANSLMCPLSKPTLYPLILFLFPSPPYNTDH
jgi:hypothetical protein